MKDIIRDNYDSTVKRGLITPRTDNHAFYSKMMEELKEFSDEIFFGTSETRAEELADIILVALNCAKHNGIDIEHELRQKIKKNYERAKNKE